MRTTTLVLATVALAFVSLLPTVSAEADTAVCEDTGVIRGVNGGVFACNEGDGPCAGVFFDEGNGYYDSDDETLGYCPGPSGGDSTVTCKDSGVIAIVNAGVFACNEGDGPCAGVFFDEGNGYYDSDDETLGYCPGPNDQ